MKILVAICLLILVSCLPVKMQRDVVEAYTRARTSILTEEKVSVDVLWVLAQVSENNPDKGIKTFIDEMKKGIPTPNYLPKVFPSEAKIALPGYVGQGVGRFFKYVQVPRGEPEDTALLHLNNFIAEKHSGYILTHQFIVLVLAEQAGLPISEKMLLRKNELWGKIYDEQIQIGSVDCIDLYMERLALILHYGDKKKIDRKNVTLWIQKMINVQLPDGSWPLSKGIISYDGGTTSLSTPRSHTTALAMMALNAYIHW